MKALIFAVLICPVVAFGTGCAEAPYPGDTRPAGGVPVAPVPARKSAVALGDPTIVPLTAAPIPTRKPAIALNEPIIIIGTADGSAAPPDAGTSSQ